MSNVPLVRRAIVGATLSHNAAPPPDLPNPLVISPTQENQWTPAALERAGSTLKALNRMAKRPPVHLLFEDLTYTVNTRKGECIVMFFFCNVSAVGRLMYRLGRIL